MTIFGSTALAQSDLPAAEWAYVQLPDADMEAEARELMLELRCLVFQGQSIADSDAEMAGDMRHLVRERMLNRWAADPRAEPPPED